MSAWQNWEGRWRRTESNWTCWLASWRNWLGGNNWRNWRTRLPDSGAPSSSRTPWGRRKNSSLSARWSLQDLVTHREQLQAQWEHRRQEQFEEVRQEARGELAAELLPAL